MPENKRATQTLFQSTIDDETKNYVILIIKEKHLCKISQSIWKGVVFVTVGQGHRQTALGCLKLTTIM